MHFVVYEESATKQLLGTGQFIAKKTAQQNADPSKKRRSAHGCSQRKLVDYITKTAFGRPVAQRDAAREHIEFLQGFYTFVLPHPISIHVAPAPICQGVLPHPISTHVAPAPICQGVLPATILTDVSSAAISVSYTPLTLPTNVTF